MEIFDKEEGDKWWVVACAVLFLTALAGLGSLFYTIEECGEKVTTVRKPTVGIYDRELSAYCSSVKRDRIPPASYFIDGRVTYVTSCSQARKYGIID